MWIEVFSTGIHRDSNGVSNEYDDAKLSSIVKMYNESVLESDSYEAPLVKGHPQSNAPAYGWIEKLAKRGKILMAKLKGISPELGDEIRKGRYKKVSISLYGDNMLRHIGILGAIPPAVKGLKNIEFADKGSCNYEQSEKDIFIRQDFSEIMEENILLATKLECEKKANQRLKLEKFRSDTNEFIENCFNNKMNKLTPSSKERLLNLFELCGDINVNNVELTIKNRDYTFKDDGNEMIKGLREFIESLEFINFDVSFNDSDEERQIFNGLVDNERLAIHNKAMDISQNSKDVNYEEAISLVLNK